MAPQFYSRYIPPASGVNVEITAAHATSSSSKRSKRKRENEDTKEEIAPEKTEPKRKKKEAAKGVPLKDVNGPELEGSRHDGQSSPSKPAREGKDFGPNGTSKLKTKSDAPSILKKKKRKTKTQGTLTVENGASTPEPGNGAHEVEAPTDSKHRRVFSKLEKSKLASESKREATEREEPQQPHEPPDESKMAHGLVPLPQPEDAPDESLPGISALPDWLSKPLRAPASSKASFESLGLSDATVRVLHSARYSETLPVQSAILPMLLPGPGHSHSDLCISAATGSGKTLAYTLPLIADLKKSTAAKLRAVIVVPTRELVTQVQATFQTCGADDSIRVGTATGSRALKEEQKLLMRRIIRYDPVEYVERQKDSEGLEEALLDYALDMDDQEADLALTENFVVDHESAVNVLICTPGRLVEHLRSTRGFTLEFTRWLVIDEADRLLDQSFQEWTDCVIPAIHAEPKVDPMIQQLRAAACMVTRKRLRKIILSATLTKDVAKLAPLRLHQPKLVVVEGATPTQDDNANESKEAEEHDENVKLDIPATLEELAIPVKRAGEKPLYVVELLKDLFEKTIDHEPGFTDGETTDETETSSIARGMLVFTNSNESALRLARLLCILKPELESQIRSLTKSTGTSTGRKVINAFAKGKISVIIASDRASRGLDLPNLAHVVNYDMPASLTSYVHRAGRTARANKSGRATTLVTFNEARWFWNDIGRSDKIRRTAKVSRDDNFFRRINKEMSEKYEDALGQLEEEATGTKGNS